MDNNMEQLFAGANSFDTYFQTYLAHHVLVAIGSIESLDEKTHTATVRAPINDPVRVYAEYHNVEVLLPSGVSCPVSNMYCLLFAPQVPVAIGDKEGLTLYNNAGPYDTKALKAIPLVPFNLQPAYGAGTTPGGFSMFTPFGNIGVSSSGMGIYYQGKDAKTEISIDPEGVININKDGQAIIFENDSIQLIAHGENRIRRIVLNPSSLSVNLQDTEEEDIFSLTVDTNGNVQLTTDENSLAITSTNVVIQNKQGEDSNTVTLDSDGITLEDKTGNTVEMSSTGISLKGQMGSVEIQ